MQSLNDIPSDLLKFLGSVTFPPHDDVKASFTSLDANTTLLKLQANSSRDFGPGIGYDRPHVFVRLSPYESSDAANLHFLGFQASEFCLPVRAHDTDLNFDLFNRPGFVRPASVFPLFIMSHKTPNVLLLAPVDMFHEQVMVVPRHDENDKTLKWGWSGDLQSVDINFSTTLQLIVDDSPRKALHRWGQSIQISRTASMVKELRYSTKLLSTLSYWTDNGAAYWYRREKDHTIQQSVVKAIQGIESECSVRIGCVELDSWFYPHEKTRAVSDVGYMHIVPPTGLMKWEPRSDIFDASSWDSPLQIHRDLSERPLVLHTRHISAKSPYIEESANSGNWWIDNGTGRAHPTTGGLWTTWAQQAVGWGAATVEHDWLVEVWQGVSQLRQGVGRIRTWLTDFANEMHAQGLSTLWCMATPADLMTVANCTAFPQPPSVARSSDDYRYADDPSTLWRWHLTCSVLLSSLGILPFKDVFMSYDRRFSSAHGEHNDVQVTQEKVSIDGDPNALLEACLATLSAGPVGIGDRVGHHGKQAVRACSREDGILIKPDAPLQACDSSLRDFHDVLWADTYSLLWRYALGVCTAGKWGYERRESRISVEKQQLQPNCIESTGLDSTATSYQVFENDRESNKHKQVLVFDWRSRSCAHVKRDEGVLDGEGHLSLTMGNAHDWSLSVICPIFSFTQSSTCFSIIGDLDVFATMGDRRIRVITPITTPPQYDQSVVSIPGSELAFDIVGAPGERVRVLTWIGDLHLAEVKIPSKSWTRGKFVCSNGVVSLIFDSACLVSSALKPTLSEMCLPK